MAKQQPEVSAPVVEETALTHLASIAKSLARLADKFCPTQPGMHRGMARLPTCTEGHGMQPGETDCQVCDRANRPGPRAA